MRVTALGAYFMKGTAQKTGKAYDMAKLVIRTPIETVANQNMQKGGYGNSTNELDIDPPCIGKFAMDYPPQGIDLDLEIGSQIKYGRLQSVIIGCSRG